MGKPSASSPIALEDALRLLRNQLPKLKEEFQVKNVGVFGSYVRGEARPRSDLDLLVEFDRAPTLFQFVRLERQFSVLLGVKVDLVMKSALKPEIGKRILREVVPV